ncbi:MAG: MMPL family transporter [Nocardiopsaceae bacterium]|nr:MMPL family transporter [Nocardiopsaceae bacterium]
MRVHRFFAAVARWVVRLRLLVIAAWVAALVASVMLLPSLGSQVNSDPSLFLPRSAPSVQAQTLGTPVLGNGDTSRITVVAATRSGKLTSSDNAAVTREEGLLKQVNGVESVRDTGTSPSGDAVELTVVVNHASHNVAALKPEIQALSKTFARANAPAGFQMHLAGQAATNAANNKSANKATGKIGMYSVVFIVVLLLIVLRSLVAAVITFIPSVVSLLVAERLIGELGSHGMQISSVTQTLLIVLMLGAGTDYGLFLVYRFREELRAGRDRGTAVAASLAHVGESITASAGTVILALLTLLFAGFGLYRYLAVPLALGIAVMLLAGLTLLPALLSVCAPLMFRKIKPADQGGPAEPQRDGLWGRIAGRAVRRPVAVLTIGVLVFAGLALAVTGYKTANVTHSTSAPAGSDVAKGNAILASDFPASTGNPSDLILRYSAPVWKHPQDLATAQDKLRGSGQFTGLAGPLGTPGQAGASLTAQQYAALHSKLGPPATAASHAKGVVAPPGGSGGSGSGASSGHGHGHGRGHGRGRGQGQSQASDLIPRAEFEVYRATAPYVSSDGLTVRFTAGLTAGSQTSTAGMNATPAVRAALAKAASASHATDSGVAGQAAGLYDVSSTANSDMSVIIPIAVVAIAILLALVLRSLIAPLYLVVTIAASYLAALGLTTLLVITLGGADGLVYLLPFLMFIFLLALGEDYNILIMTRIREEARLLPLKEAVIRAIGRTGPTVTSAGLILAGTFAVFAVFGGGVMGGQLQAIGLGLALGVLLDTFGVRTLLVPSIVVLCGRWNWWPSRLSARARHGSGGPPPPPMQSPPPQRRSAPAPW